MAWNSNLGFRSRGLAVGHLFASPGLQQARDDGAGAHHLAPMCCSIAEPSCPALLNCVKKLALTQTALEQGAAVPTADPSCTSCGFNNMLCMLMWSSLGQRSRLDNRNELINTPTPSIYTHDADKTLCASVHIPAGAPLCCSVLQSMV